MTLSNYDLFDSVKIIIVNARQRVYRMANSTLLETYWQIGKLIVEAEQQGNAKAQYGKGTLKKLSQALTLGKGMIIPILLICVIFIQHFQFLTQCVKN